MGFASEASGGGFLVRKKTNPLTLSEAPVIRMVAFGSVGLLGIWATEDPRSWCDPNKKSHQ